MDVEKISLLVRSCEPGRHAYGEHDVIDIVSALSRRLSALPEEAERLEALLEDRRDTRRLFDAQRLIMSVSPVMADRAVAAAYGIGPGPRPMVEVSLGRSPVASVYRDLSAIDDELVPWARYEDLIAALDWERFAGRRVRIVVREMGAEADAVIAAVMELGAESYDVVSDDG